MSIEGLIIAVFIALLVLLLVALPFLRRQGQQKSADSLREKQRERLLVYYERVLRNIRDLDEDHALGKIATDEHQQERELWAARGVQVLKALDTLADQPVVTATTADDSAIDVAIDDAIEAAVRDVRRSRQPDSKRVAE
jgi:hypothetical protein